MFVEGHPVVPGKADAATLFQASSPGYLVAMGIRLLRGRQFTDHDTRGATPVVIVDDTLVRRLFPDVDPIGKRISFETLLQRFPVLAERFQGAPFDSETRGAGPLEIE